MMKSLVGLRCLLLFFLVVMIMVTIETEFTPNQPFLNELLARMSVPAELLQESNSYYSSARMEALRFRLSQIEECRRNGWRESW